MTLTDDEKERLVTALRKLVEIVAPGSVYRKPLLEILTVLDEAEHRDLSERLGLNRRCDRA